MTTRDRLVILVVLAAAAVVGAWLLVVQPKRQQAAQLSTQISAEQTQLATAQAQVAAGESARRQFSSQYTELAQLGEAVPPDDNVPSLIYQLQSAAKSARVDFHNLQLNPNAAANATPPAGSAVKPSAAPAAGTLPPGVAVGPAGLPAEQFTFTFNGNFFHLSDFFNRLERFVIANSNHISISGRLMTINAINLGPAASGFPNMTANVSATTYVMPASQGAFGGATPAGPASSSSAQAGTTSGSSSPAAAAAVTSIAR